MDRAPTNPLGDELKRWCKTHGVTQSAFAMRLGISASHLNQIINGRVRPGASLVRRIRELMSNQRTRNPGLGSRPFARSRLPQGS